MNATDMTRDLLTRLVVAALGTEPPPLEQLIAEARGILRAHALALAEGSVSAAARRVGTSSRNQIRSARGWLERETPLRLQLAQLPVATWRVATVPLGPDGSVLLPLSPEARALVCSGPCRVTVERFDV